MCSLAVLSGGRVRVYVCASCGAVGERPHTGRESQRENGSDENDSTRRNGELRL